MRHVGIKTNAACSIIHNSETIIHLFVMFTENKTWELNQHAELTRWHLSACGSQDFFVFLYGFAHVSRIESWRNDLRLLGSYDIAFDLKCGLRRFPCVPVELARYLNNMSPHDLGRGHVYVCVNV